MVKVSSDFLGYSGKIWDCLVYLGTGRESVSHFNETCIILITVVMMKILG